MVAAVEAALVVAHAPGAGVVGAGILVVHLLGATGTDRPHAPRREVVTVGGTTMVTTAVLTVTELITMMMTGMVDTKMMGAGGTPGSRFRLLYC